MLQVGEEIIRWAMSTPNQVAPLSEVIKMNSRLSSDALTYQALFLWGRLGSAKIKEDGSSEADWVQGLSSLVGTGECIWDIPLHMKVRLGVGQNCACTIWVKESGTGLYPCT